MYDMVVWKMSLLYMHLLLYAMCRHDCGTHHEQVLLHAKVTPLQMHLSLDHRSAYACNRQTAEISIRPIFDLSTITILVARVMWIQNGRRPWGTNLCIQRTVVRILGS